MPLRALDRAWRLAMTGVAFAVLLVGGFLLTVTVIPATTALVRDPRRRAERAQQIIRQSFRIYVALLRAAGVIGLDVVGAAQLTRMRGKLIVANHPTLLDIVLVMSLVPRACCVAKHQLWHHPLLGRLVRAAGYIRNDQEPEDFIAECQAALAAGSNLVIFPEGTRSVPGEKLRFQRGFAHIATLTRSDIQVVTITCEPITLLKGERWYSIPERRAIFRLELVNEVSIEPFLNHQSRAIGVRRLVSHLEAFYWGRLQHGRA